MIMRGLGRGAYTGATRRSVGAMDFPCQKCGKEAEIILVNGCVVILCLCWQCFCGAYENVKEKHKQAERGRWN